jgi:hypothetical protein
LLERVQVSRYILKPDVSQVLIIFDLVKDWTPDRHLPRTVSRGKVVSGNDGAHPFGRKRTTVSLCEGAELWKFCLQGSRSRAISVTVYAMA